MKQLNQIGDLPYYFEEWWNLERDRQKEADVENFITMGRDSIPSLQI
jgi:hypothetical protein